MKLLKALLIPLVCLYLVSCQKNEVRIYGEVKNPNGELLLLSDNLIYDFIDTLKIVDNKFDITLLIDKAAIRTFNYGMGHKDLFLKPGYELKLFFDGRNIDSSYQVEGNGALENYVLDSLGQFLGDLKFRELSTKDFQNPYLTIENSYKRTLAKFDSLISTKRVDNAFVSFVKKSVKYREISEMILVNLERKDSTTKISENIDSIQIEEPSLLYSPNYRRFLDFYIAYKIPNFRNLEYDPRLDKIIELISNFSDKSIKEFLLFNNIGNYNINDIDDLDKYYSYFNSVNTDSSYAKALRRQYIKRKPLSSGKIAPTFSASDLDSIVFSLENFKGKFVYIDVWATWCSPCIQESPFLDTLQKDYQSKNIQFVGISIDQNKERWKKYLANKEKNDIKQLIAKGGYESNFAVNYQIQGIPTFILIDPNGKIVDASAPRPSSKNIRTILDSLLKVN